VLRSPRAAGKHASLAEHYGRDREERRVSLMHLLAPAGFVHEKADPAMTGESSPSTDSSTAAKLRAVAFHPTFFPEGVDPFDPSARTKPLEGIDPVFLHADMALRATGYAAAPLPTGLEGVYAVGWARNGGRGVLAGTMEDAFAVGERVVSELKNGVGPGGRGRRDGWMGVREMLGGKRVVNWEDWKVIDGVERERGKKLGKEREKIVSVEEMMRVLDG
jgi:hypothetical protein